MTTLSSVAQVAELVRAAGAPGRRTVIGIVGAPGAGKSTLAESLVEALGATAVLLPMDGFHLPQATLVSLGRRDRMGAPDTFDVPALLAVMARIRDVESSTEHVLAPGFDREIEEPVADAIDVTPESSTVVVEGNYLLLDRDGWEGVADSLDLSFFLEIDDAVRLERLVARHERFGKGHDDAIAWANGPDEANARVIAATAPRADYRIALG